MTTAMRPQEWVSFVERTYLEDFIAAGGASVKFAVPAGELERTETRSALERAACGHGYVFVSVDAATTRIHMIDQLFSSIARQLPWRDLAAAYVRRTAKLLHYDAPPSSDRELLAVLAEANDTDPGVVHAEMRAQLSRTVYRDPQLAKDFRMAMYALCMAELLGGEEGDATRESIIEWITGAHRRITPVKQFGIFATVNRNNARFMFESLLCWLRQNEWTGLVLMLDTAQLDVPRRTGDGQFYTRLMLLDAYEVLRQFVDSTDRLTGCLMVVSAGKEFLNVEVGGRGLGAYEALKFRVYDEIRDRRLVNPMSALMRLDRQAMGDAL